MRFKLKRENPCPSCGKNLDGASGITDDTAQPTTGDLSVCAYCYTMLKFDENLISHPLTVDEFVDLPVDMRNELKSAVSFLKDISNGR